MISVEVKNFQSIEHLTFQVNGFTALVGPSNIGKSALVRAVRSALTNAPVDATIRHESGCARVVRGAKTCKCLCSVRIKGDNLDFLWEKGDSITKYVVNGLTYSNPGREKGSLDFLIAAGLSPIKIGDNPSHLQIAEQFSPIFLLNQSGPSIAESISDVARLDRVVAASKLVEKDLRQTNSTLKTRKGDVDKAKDKLKTYDNLDNELALAERVASSFIKLQTHSQKIQDLSRFTTGSEVLLGRIRNLWGVGSVQIPASNALLDKDAAFRQALKLSNDLDQRTLEVERLQWVEEVCPPDISQLRQLQDRLQKASRLVLSLNDREEALSKLSSVEPTLQRDCDITPMYSTAKTLRRVDTWVDRLRSFRGRFDTLTLAEKVNVPATASVVSAQVKVRELGGFLHKLRVVEDRIKSLESDLADAEREETSVHSEVMALGVCPMCARPTE